ncbi:MAG: DNA topoisomerase IV subunit A, partial [Betaproteobacteria bacterium HGW-Betaproteobacteria-19]
WPLIVIDTHGRAYTVKAAELPGGRGDGVPIATLVEFQDGGKAAQVVADQPDASYFFANSGSYGFISTVAGATSRQRAGKAFMVLEKGETVLPPAKVCGEWIAAASASGRVLMFPRAEMKVQAGGRGVIVMGMDEGETLCAVAVPADDAVLTVEGIGRGNKPATVVLKPAQRENMRHRRARKGVQLAIRLKPERMS